MVHCKKKKCVYKRFAKFVKIIRKSSFFFFFQLKKKVLKLMGNDAGFSLLQTTFHVGLVMCTTTLLTHIQQAMFKDFITHDTLLNWLGKLLQHLVGMACVSTHENVRAKQRMANLDVTNSSGQSCSSSTRTGSSQKLV